MNKESFFMKLKRLFCMGPFLLIVIFISALILNIISNRLSLPIGLNRPTQLILTTIIIFVYLTSYISFMIMLRKYSMGKSVIKSGPYRIVRHPLYSIFSFTIPAVLVIWFNDYWFILSWVITIISAHFLVKVEEKILIEKFENEYIEYKKKVPAIIPYKGIVKL